MAEIAWTHPALEDLERIADYIRLDNPSAALRSCLVFARRPVAALALAAYIRRALEPPLSRQIIEPPCRIFYRVEVAGGPAACGSERQLRPTHGDELSTPAPSHADGMTSTIGCRRGHGGATCWQPILAFAARVLRCLRPLEPGIAESATATPAVVLPEGLRFAKSAQWSRHTRTSVAAR
jgi:toxin ParE1/3/4